MKKQSQAGSSLVELVVGAAIALIALGAILALQIRTYHFQRADSRRFVTQMEAVNALDRLVADLRTASAIEGLESGEGSSITLVMEGRRITYSFEADRDQVVRLEGGRSQILGQGVDSFHLVQTADRTIQIEWVGRLVNGGTYHVSSSGLPRLASY